jgi:DNA-binding HxlR family transcriptional regulator
MTARKQKHLSLAERSAYHSLEDIVGCKWSAGVVASIGRGVRRPGELERYIPGISKKILNERLRKLTEYRVVEREEIPDRVQHVEYRLTPTGEKLAALIEQLHALGQQHIDSLPRG